MVKHKVLTEPCSHGKGSKLAIDFFPANVSPFPTQSPKQHGCNCAMRRFPPAWCIHSPKGGSAARSTAPEVKQNHLYHQPTLKPVLVSQACYDKISQTGHVFLKVDLGVSVSLWGPALPLNVVGEKSRSPLPVMGVPDSPKPLPL